MKDKYPMLAHLLECAIQQHQLEVHNMSVALNKKANALKTDSIGPLPSTSISPNTTRDQAHATHNNQDYTCVNTDDLEANAHDFDLFDIDIMELIDLLQTQDATTIMDTLETQNVTHATNIPSNMQVDVAIPRASVIQYAKALPATATTNHTTTASTPPQDYTQTKTNDTTLPMERMDDMCDNVTQVATTNQTNNILTSKSNTVLQETQSSKTVPNTLNVVVLDTHTQPIVHNTAEQSIPATNNNQKTTTQAKKTVQQLYHVDADIVKPVQELDTITDTKSQNVIQVEQTQKDSVMAPQDTAVTTSSQTKDIDVIDSINTSTFHYISRIDEIIVIDDEVKSNTFEHDGEHYALTETTSPEESDDNEQHTHTEQYDIDMFDTEHNVTIETESKDKRKVNDKSAQYTNRQTCATDTNKEQHDIYTANTVHRFVASTENKNHPENTGIHNALVKQDNISNQHDNISCHDKLNTNVANRNPTSTKLDETECIPQDAIPVVINYGTDDNPKYEQLMLLVVEPEAKVNIDDQQTTHNTTKTSHIELDTTQLVKQLQQQNATDNTDADTHKTKTNEETEYDLPTTLEIDETSNDFSIETEIDETERSLTTESEVDETSNDFSIETEIDETERSLTTELVEDSIQITSIHQNYDTEDTSIFQDEIPRPTLVLSPITTSDMTTTQSLYSPSSITVNESQNTLLDINSKPHTVNPIRTRTYMHRRILTRQQKRIKPYTTTRETKNTNIPLTSTKDNAHTQTESTTHNLTTMTSTCSTNKTATNTTDTITAHTALMLCTPRIAEEQEPIVREEIEHILLCATNTYDATFSVQIVSMTIDNIWKELLRAFLSKHTTFQFQFKAFGIRRDTTDIELVKQLYTNEMLEQQACDVPYQTTYARYNGLYRCCQQQDIANTRAALNHMKHRLHHRLFVYTMFFQCNLLRQQSADCYPRNHNTQIKTYETYPILFKKQTKPLMKSRYHDIEHTLNTLVEAEYEQFIFILEVIYQTIHSSYDPQLLTQLRDEMYELIMNNIKELTCEVKNKIQRIVNRFGAEDCLYFKNLQRYLDFILLVIPDVEIRQKLQKIANRFFLQCILSQIVEYIQTKHKRRSFNSQ